MATLIKYPKRNSEKLDTPAFWQPARAAESAPFPGQVLSPYAFLVNISERSLTRETAITNVLATAGIGMWSYSVYAKKFHLDPVASQFFGLKGSITFSLAALMRKLVEWKQEEVLSIATTACKTNQEFEAQLLINNKENDLCKWVKITGKLYCNDGIAMKMMGTITDITALKREENLKKDLMAFLSHELRTPLSVAKIYIQNAGRLAKDDHNTAIECKMTQADQQMVFMAGLIDNFLTLSQVQNNRLSVHKNGFYLNELIVDVMSNMTFLFPERVFKFDLSEPVWVYADQDKIVQVLTNYITNSVKFSSSKSHVHIACKKSGSNAIVSVKDKGCGIEPEGQKLLFNKYCRVEQENQIRTKGYGLGLFLCREIIESHDGKVWVKSEVDKGSTFYFSLPVNEGDDIDLLS
ncbi:MAG: PAS domain-containing sensor histidine kinase [Mucilaginibacter sp.]|uniref:sensor histidine kinase n=1 Tax=Mucilaginibacter sp. TaxID=1882438 RepID=UPI0031A2E2CB